jgi:hypothetical protein
MTDDQSIQPTVLNGTTPVTVLMTPPSGTKFYLTSFSMTNTDTAAVVVSILLNGVAGIVYQLATGDVLQFGKNTDAWTVLSTNGAAKQTIDLGWSQLGGSPTDSTQLASLLAAKADASATASALAAKADASATASAINAKLDLATNGIVTTTVNAGADQAVTLPATASLVGTASDDGSPAGVYTHTWTKVSGPGTVTFGNAALLSTTAAFSVAGTYVLRLTANDGNYNTSDDMTVVAS